MQLGIRKQFLEQINWICKMAMLGLFFLPIRLYMLWSWTLITSCNTFCFVLEFLCCNEPDPHRQKWLAKTLESFLPHSMTSRVIVSAQDGRYFGHRECGKYDKVGRYRCHNCFLFFFSKKANGCFCTKYIKSKFKEVSPLIICPSCCFLTQVLVDAPCSNDRSWLYSPSSQQGEQRLKERAMLPALQAQLLK